MTTPIAKISNCEEINSYLKNNKIKGGRKGGEGKVKYVNRCGKQYDNQACDPGRFCSDWNWCGGAGKDSNGNTWIGGSQNHKYDGPMKDCPGAPPKPPPYPNHPECEDKIKWMKQYGNTEFYKKRGVNINDEGTIKTFLGNYEYFCPPVDNKFCNPDPKKRDYIPSNMYNMIKGKCTENKYPYHPHCQARIDWIKKNGDTEFFKKNGVNIDDEQSILKFLGNYEYVCPQIEDENCNPNNNDKNFIMNDNFKLFNGVCTDVNKNANLENIEKLEKLLLELLKKYKITHTKLMDEFNKLESKYKKIDNSNYKGNDISNHVNIPLEDCMNYCSNNEKCAGIVYNEQQCMLKNKIDNEKIIADSKTTLYIKETTELIDEYIKQLTSLNQQIMNILKELMILIDKYYSNGQPIRDNNANKKKELNKLMDEAKEENKKLHEMASSFNTKIGENDFVKLQLKSQLINLRVIIIISIVLMYITFKSFGNFKVTNIEIGILVLVSIHLLYSLYEKYVSPRMPSHDDIRNVL